MKVTGLKKLHKLRDTEPGIGNQRPQKTLPKLPMLRNRQHHARTVLFQHDVAATLPIHNPAGFDESSHGRCPRTDGEHRAHATRISISIVSMFDGIELAARVSRLPSIASRMFAMASSRVLPCETQPGRPGHLATNQPSSSCSRVTKNCCDFATAPTVVRFCRAAKSLLCRLRGRAGRGARLLQLRRWKVMSTCRTAQARVQFK